jgi:hypothetical protein
MAGKRCRYDDTSQARMGYKEAGSTPIVDSHQLHQHDHSSGTTLTRSSFSHKSPRIRFSVSHFLKSEHLPLSRCRLALSSSVSSPRHSRPWPRPPHQLLVRSRVSSVPESLESIRTRADLSIPSLRQHASRQGIHRCENGRRRFRQCSG